MRKPAKLIQTVLISVVIIGGVFSYLGNAENRVQETPLFSYPSPAKPGPNPQSARARTADQPPSAVETRLQTIRIGELSNVPVQVPAGKVREYSLLNMLGSPIDAADTSARGTSFANRGVFFLNITYADGRQHVQKLIHLD